MLKEGSRNRLIVEGSFIVWLDVECLREGIERELILLHRQECGTLVVGILEVLSSFVALGCESVEDFLSFLVVPCLEER